MARAGQLARYLKSSRANGWALPIKTMGSIYRTLHIVVWPWGYLVYTVRVCWGLTTSFCHLYALRLQLRWRWWYLLVELINVGEPGRAVQQLKKPSQPPTHVCIWYCQFLKSGKHIPTSGRFSLIFRSHVELWLLLSFTRTFLYTANKWFGITCTLYRLTSFQYVEYFMAYSVSFWLLLAVFSSWV